MRKEGDLLYENKHSHKIKKTEGYLEIDAFCQQPLPGKKREQLGIFYKVCMCGRYRERAWMSGWGPSGWALFMSCQSANTVSHSEQQASPVSLHFITHTIPLLFPLILSVSFFLFLFLEGGGWSSILASFFLDVDSFFNPNILYSLFIPLD